MNLNLPSQNALRNRPGRRAKKVMVPKCRVCKAIDSFYRKKWGYPLECEKCGAEELEMFMTKIKWEDY